MLTVRGIRNCTPAKVATINNRITNMRAEVRSPPSSLVVVIYFGHPLSPLASTMMILAEIALVTPLNFMEIVFPSQLGHKFVDGHDCLSFGE